MPITRSGFGRSPKPKIIPIGETEDAAAGGSDQQCPDQRIKAQRIEMMPIERLIPNPRNAKKHPPKQIAFLSESMKRFGLNQPLVIDRNYKIHCGHARYEAARKIGLSQVPVIKRKDLTDAELKALAIADNKLSELGEWDMECQSAPKFDPVSASNFDPLGRRALPVALVSSELAGVAETRRARVV